MRQGVLAPHLADTGHARRAVTDPCSSSPVKANKSGQYGLCPAVILGDREGNTRIFGLRYQLVLGQPFSRGFLDNTAVPTN